MAVNPHLKIHNLVDNAVGHELSVPEFQRGFVWKPAQVRDLAESLSLDYPIGSLLIWNSRTGAQERVVSDSRHPADWLVDGQQRTTALCILFGRKPYWWPDAESWEKAMRRYDIRFDVEANEEPYFKVADAAIRKTKAHRWIRLSDVLQLDTNRPADSQKLQELAKTIKLEGLCGNMDAMEVYARLDHVHKIREKDLVVITVEHELEDVVEIFARYEASFNLPFYWFLQASRFGRYSTSGSTALDEDLRAIGESTTLRDAVVRLLDRFEHTSSIEPDDFMVDYGDSRFGRFLLYLLVWQNKAKDWDERGYLLGFEGVQVLESFQPQWHHVFPKKFLGSRYDELEINALANIAVIGPTINIRISAKNPMEYLEKYKITTDKLTQQYIPDNLKHIPIEKYPDFLKSRSVVLAMEANKYLGALRDGIEEN